jgi:glyoxylase I family protein
MPVIKKLSHVCLYLDDLDKAQKLFVDILGMPFANEMINNDGQRYGFMLESGEGTFVEVIKSEMYSVGQKFHFCLEVTDIYKWHTMLKELDYEISNVRRGKTDKVLQFFFYPESNLPIEMWEHDSESIYLQKGLV